MKDNSKCITISLSTSTCSHCFVGIEVNLGSVEVGYERQQYMYYDLIVNIVS